MLVSFTLSNYRSFRAEQTLSMVAAPDEKHRSHLTALPGRFGALLPVAVLYGPNGAGKSNLIRGFEAVKRAVLDGLEHQRFPSFALDAVSPKQPTEFVVRFVFAGHMMEYGFREDPDGVEAEWLLELVDDKEERIMFERSRTAIELGDTVSLGDSKERMQALVTLGVKAGRLFLTQVDQQIERNQLPEVFRETLEFFERIRVIRPAAHFAGFERKIAEDPQFAEHVGLLLQKADTGVLELKALEESLEQEKLQRLLEKNVKPTFSVQGADISIYGRDDNVFITKVQALHQCEDGRERGLDFEEESDGTRRLAHLAPALMPAERGHVVLIDEFERSLHPELSKRFLMLILRDFERTKSQAILTTHESCLLDQELLRRDEIWFAEKDAASLETELRSLAEYKVRPDLRLAKGYLAGRFGAVPHLHGFDRLEDLVKSSDDEPARA